MYAKFFIILNFKIYALLKIIRSLKTISPKNNKTPKEMANSGPGHECSGQSMRGKKKKGKKAPQNLINFYTDYKLK